MLEQLSVREGDGGALSIRPPRLEDGSRIWELLGRIPGLERNSCYAYLLLCSHFAPTCLLAEADGDVVGFVLAYRPPVDPGTVFVWQIGTSPEARRWGIAGRLLDTLIAQPACRDATGLAATVGSDNGPSEALFRAFARRHGAVCETRAGFSATLFPEPHPTERLFYVPLTKGAA